LLIDKLVVEQLLKSHSVCLLLNTLIYQTESTYIAKEIKCFGKQFTDDQTQSK